MPLFGPLWGEQVYQRLIELYSEGASLYTDPPGRDTTAAGVKAACALAGFQVDSLRHANDKATCTVSRPMPTTSDARLAGGGGLLVLAHLFEIFGDFDFWDNYDHFSHCAWLVVTECDLSALLALKRFLASHAYDHKLRQLYRHNTSIETHAGRLDLEEMRAVLAVTKWVGELVREIANCSGRLSAIPGLRVSSNSEAQSQLMRQSILGLDSIDPGLLPLLPVSSDMEQLRPVSFEKIWPYIARSINQHVYLPHQEAIKKLLRNGVGRQSVDMYIAYYNMPETLVDSTTWRVLRELTSYCHGVPSNMAAVNERLSADMQVVNQQIEADMQRCGAA